jgi:hypothetical protein
MMTTADAETLRVVLRHELARRRETNPRYSLRSFANALGVDHSGLSRFLRGVRSARRRTVVDLWSRVRPDRDARSLLALLRADATAADSRRCAAALSISVDRVNIALQHLLSAELVSLEGRRWRTR